MTSFRGFWPLCTNGGKAQGPQHGVGLVDETMRAAKDVDWSAITEVTLERLTEAL
eukprot:m.115243 g.115243  ORF g.115243 m.115243 type:complete len:55 (-) comp9470_c2_seq2:511-675(-)